MAPPKTRHAIHVMLLGDKGIGRTTLARTITEGRFPSAENVRRYTTAHYRTDKYLSDVDTKLTTRGIDYYLHTYDLLLEKSEISRTIKSLTKKKKTVVCYLCFDLSRPDSFNNIKLKWFPIIKKVKFSGPIFVVGIKADSYSSEGSQPIRDSVASEVANEIGAVSFCKISSKRLSDIHELKRKTLVNFQDSRQENSKKGKQTKM